MSAPLNPADADAKAAAKKAKKELERSELKKGCDDYMKKGFSEKEALKKAKRDHKHGKFLKAGVSSYLAKGFSQEEAEQQAHQDLKKAHKVVKKAMHGHLAAHLKKNLAAGMEPEKALKKALKKGGFDPKELKGGKSDAPIDGVKKALEDVAGILGQPQMNQAIVSKDKMDELVKSLDGSAKGQFEAVQGEMYHTRKVLREYVDSTRALGKAVQAMGEELVKALSDMQFAQADSVQKSLSTETVPAHLSTPKATDAPRAVETKAVPTPAENVDVAKVSVGDFIEKANSWIENNPRDPIVKSLAVAIGELCSPGGDLKAQMDQFGKTIGLV
jgi:hypothetical protein